MPFTKVRGLIYVDSEFVILSLHKVYKAHEVNTCRTVSAGSLQFTSAPKPDLRMQSSYLLHLLDGDALNFGFVKLFVCLLHYRMSLVQT